MTEGFQVRKMMDRGINWFEKCYATDIGDGRRHADFYSGVSLFGQFTLEELVQLGVEDAIGDEFPTL